MHLLALILYLITAALSMNFDQPAQTEYTVLGHEGDHTLLKFKLLTGRTHQIRVHMEHIGHPIVGDAMLVHVINHIRQCLMHQNSTFVPYGKDEPMTVNCEVGDDFGREK